MMAEYGGVQRSDKRKQAAPKGEKKDAKERPPGSGTAADQATGFTGKRTYESPGKDADQQSSEGAPARKA